MSNRNGTLMHRHLNNTQVLPFIGLSINETVIVTVAVFFLGFVLQRIMPVNLAIPFSFFIGVAYTLYVRKQLKKDPRFREALRSQLLLMKPNNRNRTFHV